MKKIRTLELAALTFGAAVILAAPGVYATDGDLAQASGVETTTDGVPATGGDVPTGAISGETELVSGTVEAFNEGTGLLRLTTEGGAVRSYRVTDETTVLENGQTSTEGNINKGDQVALQLRSGSDNQVERVEIL